MNVNSNPSYLGSMKSCEEHRMMFPHGEECPECIQVRLAKAERGLKEAYAVLEELIEAGLGITGASIEARRKAR